MKMTENGTTLEVVRLSKNTVSVHHHAWWGSKTTTINDGGAITKETHLMQMLSRHSLSGHYGHPEKGEKDKDIPVLSSEDDQWDIRALKGVRYDPFTGNPA